MLKLTSIKFSIFPLVASADQALILAAAASLLSKSMDSAVASKFNYDFWVENTSSIINRQGNEFITIFLFFGL